MSEAIVQREEDPVEAHAEYVLAFLGLTWDDLRGKRVLDIGAGRAELARVGKRHGVEIVSLDIRSPGANIHASVPYQLGDALRMEFPAGSFDIALCHAGPLTMAAGTAWQRPFINESLRVLKTGGELRFAPYFNQTKKRGSRTADKQERLLALTYPNLEKRPGITHSTDRSDEQKFYFRIEK